MTSAHHGLSARVDDALLAAVLRLRAAQSPDGAWRSDCDQGPAVTAQAALALAWLSPLEPSLAAGICRGLVARQLPDGGWASAPFAETADLGSTATCWAALVRLGCGDSAAIARGAQAVEVLGGLSALSGQIREADTAAWFVALAGLLPPEALPRLPLRWRRSVLLVRWLEEHVHDGVQLLLTQLAVIQRHLSGEWGPERRERPEARAVVELLDRYQNADGSWGGFVPIHALALAAMQACGERGERLQRGRAWLQSRVRHSEDGSIWFSAYDPDIWVTGISMRALCLAGVPAEDPAIRGGAGWLLRSQSHHPLSRALQRQRGAPRTGGWAFGGTGPALVDTDDTGIAMLALSHCTALPGVCEAIAAGREYLLAMQNPDGGFPAFTWNVSRRTAQPPRLLRPGTATTGLRDRLALLRMVSMNLSDPPSEDATGRILRALAACGFSHRDAEVQHAVRWLLAAQSPAGGWWGKWVTPYMVPTADVLSGLHAVGLPLETPAVQAGLGFLLARQQDDGGWGDTTAAYFDPACAGRAPSSCPVTAWVLTGLLPWLGADHPAVLRGIRALLDRQQDDGGWPNGRHTHVYLPPDRTYILPATALMHSVEALALWRGHRAQSRGSSGVQSG